MSEMPDTAALGRQDATAGRTNRTDAGDSRVDPRVSVQAQVDPRVTMVLSVLGGAAIDAVAADWDVEPSMIHRWVRDFLVAGTAVITHRPDPDAARQRDRFLAAFAHELRTPLAVAQGWAVMLAEGDIPEADVAESLGKLHDALARLADRALDVEMMATASLGRIRLTPERVRLADLVDELDGCTGVTVGTSTSARATDDSSDGSSGEPPEAAADEVVADPRLLRRILRDLWSAAHADPVPDEVSLEIADAGPWREIRVVRTGAGFGAAHLEALFDPFDHNDDNTGVTIGLYLARALTVAQGGHIGAEEDDGRTALWIRLPRDHDQGDPAASAPGRGNEQGGNR